MPFQAWIHLLTPRGVSWYEELQWGHALSGMDTVARAGKGGRLKAELQWGHALSGMDTMDTQCLLIVFRNASMGPCPFRHGYVCVLVNAHTTHQHRFNGAMPFQAWIQF